MKQRKILENTIDYNMGALREGVVGWFLVVGALTRERFSHGTFRRWRPSGSSLDHDQMSSGLSIFAALAAISVLPLNHIFYFLLPIKCDKPLSPARSNVFQNHF